METKYELRSSSIPYYLENDISSDNTILKEFEIFDGETVKWGIRGYFIPIKKSKYCNCTPLFDNMTKENGEDKERIICKNKNTYVFHAKINNSEILGEISDSPLATPNFLKIEDFGGDSVKINLIDDRIAFVRFKKNSISKCVFFDLKEFRPCSNIFDTIYVDNNFIKSYIINDKVRVVIGRVNYTNGVVKPYGYDINTGEFFEFPITKCGMINERDMIHYLKENPSIGFDKKNYQSLYKLNLITLLLNLGIDGFNVIQELDIKNGMRCKKI